MCTHPKSQYTLYLNFDVYSSHSAKYLSPALDPDQTAHERAVWSRSTPFSLRSNLIWVYCFSKPVCPTLGIFLVKAVLIQHKNVKMKRYNSCFYSIGELYSNFIKWDQCHNFFFNSSHHSHLTLMIVGAPQI